MVKQASVPAFGGGRKHPAGMTERGGRPNENDQFGRQISSPSVLMAVNGSGVQHRQHPVRISCAPANPNMAGPRRTYGGPRVLISATKVLAAKNGSNSSLNSSASGSAGGSANGSFDSSLVRTSPVKSPGARPVVRPPTSAQDRPSFFTSGNNNTEIW